MGFGHFGEGAAQRSQNRIVFSETRTATMPPSSAVLGYHTIQYVSQGEPPDIDHGLIIDCQVEFCGNQRP
jgi:hypothetical protein